MGVVAPGEKKNLLQRRSDASAVVTVMATMIAMYELLSDSKTDFGP